MQSVSQILSEQLIIAFLATPFHSDILKIDKDFWKINYFGQNNIDYSFRKLIALSLMLKQVGANFTPEQLGQGIIKNLNSSLEDIVQISLSVPPNLSEDKKKKKKPKDKEKKQPANFVIDFKLKPTWLNSQMVNLLKLEKIIQQATKPRRILVDFSSPNIAKDMHVGHLRSTIIGDSICRLYEEQGHFVSRINHIGDYGLQFGMLIQYLYDMNQNFQTSDNITISDLQVFYANSKKKFDTDHDFETEARKRVVELQAGVPEVVKAWEFIKEISRIAYNDIYERLNIKLEEVGESFYQSRIPATIQELEDKNIIKVDQEGRQIVFVPGIKVPLFVTKSNGSVGYDTTDLVAIRYRLVELGMEQVVYVVDSGQHEHFQQIFGTARMAGWLIDQRVEHIEFGLVLGEDGLRLRSRNGDTIRLVDLLDEAVERAGSIVDNNGAELNEDEREKVIKAVAYGSIKYADLSGTRTNNYKFSFDQMLSMKGNTAPYLLYAYVRISAIIRNSQHHFQEAIQDLECINLTEPTEIAVATQIIQFPEILEKVSGDLMFHVLCNYLYDLSTCFHAFHVSCRVLEFDPVSHTELIGVNRSRLLLCEATRRVMERCFYILGLQTLTKM